MTWVTPQGGAEGILGALASVGKNVVWIAKVAISKTIYNIQLTVIKALSRKLLADLIIAKIGTWRSQWMREKIISTPNVKKIEMKAIMTKLYCAHRSTS